MSQAYADKKESPAVKMTPQRQAATPKKEEPTLSKPTQKKESFKASDFFNIKEMLDQHNANMALQKEQNEKSTLPINPSPVQIKERPRSTKKTIQKKDINEEKDISLPTTELRLEQEQQPNNPEEGNKETPSTPPLTPDLTPDLKENIEAILQQDDEQEKESPTTNKGIRVLLYNKNEEIIYLKTPFANALRQYGTVDNGTQGYVTEESTPYEYYCKVKVDGISEEVYIDAFSISYGIPEVVVSASNEVPTGGYGLIWRENLDLGNVKFILGQNGMDNNELSSIDEKSINTYFALLRGDADSNSLEGEVIDLNTRVFILENPFPGWSKVLLDDGRTGFIKSHAINTEMPDGGSQLHYIQSGETLENIINTNYKLNVAEGEKGDRRFYANAIHYANNPQNEENGSIIRAGEPNFLERIIGGNSYDYFQLKEGFWMWIPSQAYCESLAGIISSGDRTQELMKSIEGVSDDIMAVINDKWPVGWGIKLSNSIGATFGYPIGGDINLMTTVARKEDKIEFRKYSKIKAGVDSGVSAGAYFGLKGNYGVGAEAGVHAEAMLGLYTDLTYEFPFDKKGMLMLALGLTGDSPNAFNALSPMSMMIQVFTNLGNLITQPRNYLTSFEAAIGGEGQATGAVEAGVRTSKSGDNYSKSYRKNEFADDSDAKKIPLSITDPSTLLGFLNVKASVLFAGNAYAGAKIDEIQRNSETFEIEKAKATVFLKQGAQANVTTPIPILGLNGDINSSQKVIFDYEKGKEWKMSGSISLGSGELDFYQGNATEVEYNKELGNPSKWNNDTMLEHVSTLKFTKRVGFKGMLGQTRKFTANSNKMMGIETTRQKELSSAAILSASSYLTLEFQFTPKEAQLLLNTLKGLKIMQQLKIIQDFFSSGTIPNEWQNNLQKLSRTFARILTKAVWYSEIGGELAMGFQAALGAKVRIDLSAGSYVTIEKDIIDMVKQALVANELPDFLGDKIETIKTKLDTIFE